MTEKNLLKHVIDAKLPDSESVRQTIIAGDMQKSPKHFRFAPAFAVIAAVLVISLAALPLWHIPPSSLSNNTLSTISNSASSENDIYINDLNNVSTNDTRLYFDPEKTYTQQLSLAEVIDYLGRDICPTVLPEELNGPTSLNPNSTYEIIHNNDGTIAFAQFIFSYAEQFEEYDPLQKQLDIIVSKTELMTDYILIDNEQMHSSHINGQTVKLGLRQMDYGPYTVVENGPNIPAGYYDMYVAEFVYNGLYYQVVANNFTQQEFLDTLQSML